MNRSQFVDSCGGRHVAPRKIAILLSGLCLAALTSGFAQAQQSGAESNEITVTGTRIKAPNLTSDSPVSAVTSTDIAESNVQNIEEVLNHLPAVTTSLTQQQSSLVGGTTANVNLRALGINRTLSLIDGHRIGPSDASAAADLNILPTTILSGVDVLTGGASAVYGSDAVAGVVNFHVMKDLQGAIANFSYSGYLHENNNPVAQSFAAHSPFPVTPATGTSWDGFTRESSGAAGANFADNKGNVLIYGDYRSSSAVLNLARDFNICAGAPGVSQGSSYATCTGSSSTIYGTFSGLPGIKGTVINNPNGTNTFTSFNSSQLFNTTNLGYLQRQDSRTALGSFAHYTVNPHAELYTELMYMRDQSVQQSPGGGLFIGGQANYTKLNIPCNNPYLGTQPGPLGVSQYTAIGCAPGVASVNITVPGEHFTQPRQVNNIHDDYRALGGVRGDIDGNWSYDLSGSHFQSNYQYTYSGYTLLPLVQQSITAGTLNIFQYGGPTPAQQALTNATDIGSIKTGEDDVTLSVTGDLGPYHGKSPFANNPVAVAFGLEYRHTTLVESPDANLAAGNIAGIGGASPSVNGGETAKEIFGEIRIPVLEDLPFVRSMNINLGLRNTNLSVDNSGTGFDNNTYKINADYAPTADLRFRGGYNRAARSPDVFELFQPQLTTVLNGAVDPCAGNIAGTGPAFPANATLCTNPALGKAAVSQAQFQSGSIPYCNNNQCRALTGGNPSLHPEQADTWTWGVNLTPTILPGLDASVDYWDIKIANYIGPVSGTGIINGCYSGLTLYCQYINRDPQTGSIGTGNGYITETNVNLDMIHQRGIDMALNYVRSFRELGLTADDWGSLAFSVNGTLTAQSTTQQLAVVRSYDCAGLFGPTCGTPQPYWRHQAKLTWSSPWDTTFSVNWRYIGGSKLDANDPSNPGRGGATNACGGLFQCGGLNASINAVNYFDLAASYRFMNDYTLRLGVNNVFDKDPPVLTSLGIGGITGTNNNIYTAYDALGRLLFMSVQAKF